MSAVPRASKNSSAAGQAATKKNQRAGSEGATTAFSDTEQRAALEGATKDATVPYEPPRVSHAPPARSLYCFQATVVSVEDDGVFLANISQGFGAWRISETLRLAGAPKKLSREKLAALIDGRSVFIQTTKDKSGGYLAWVFVDDENGESVRVDSLL